MSMWINVFRDRRTGLPNTETNFASEADAVEEVTSGYPNLDYLYTIKVTDGIATVFDLTEIARVCERELVRERMDEILVHQAEATSLWHQHR